MSHHTTLYQPPVYQVPITQHTLIYRQAHTSTSREKRRLLILTPDILRNRHTHHMTPPTNTHEHTTPETHTETHQTAVAAHKTNTNTRTNTSSPHTHIGEGNEE